MWADGGPYEAWTDFLHRWGAGEAVNGSGLPALTEEDFAPDQWVRLSDRLGAALNRRLGSWAQSLTMAIQESRDEFGVARALTQARTGLRSIRAVAAHPGLPATLTTMFVESVDTQVRSAQQMLETQVEELRRSGVDRATVEARLRTLRHNALTLVIEDGDQPPGPVADPWLAQTGQSRRRITPMPVEDGS